MENGRVVVFANQSTKGRIIVKRDQEERGVLLLIGLFVILG